MAVNSVAVTRLHCAVVSPADLHEPGALVRHHDGRVALHLLGLLGDAQRGLSECVARDERGEAL